MEQVDIEAFSSILDGIKEGNSFEKLALSFLSSVLSYEFTPVGGTGDKGIDGYQKLFYRNNSETKIYQISTEEQYKDKIEDTVKKLRKNKKSFDSLFYITNRSINNKDLAEDEFFSKYNTPIRIWDKSWFLHNANKNQGTINIYNTFLHTYVNEMHVPNKIKLITGLHDNPNVYIFLRQQHEQRSESLRLDEFLSESLILFNLQGTDPEKGIVVSKEELLKKISKMIKFDINLITETIQERLNFLSKGAKKKIQYNAKKNGYCLPYAERIKIQQKLIDDSDIYQTAQAELEDIIKNKIKNKSINVKNLKNITMEIINKIYYNIGLEFSNFILKGINDSSLDSNLYQTISNYIDNDSSIIAKNKEEVKMCLLEAIKDSINFPSHSLSNYFKKLSNTYMMMFMLQCDPKVATYFESLANKLQLFVDTSIIIPALSEFYLDNESKKFWNLLSIANRIGIHLVINDAIIEELATHLKMIKKIYLHDIKGKENILINYFKSNNEIFDNNYEILIKSYIYAKSKNKVSNFTSYIEKFVDYDMTTVKEDISTYLKTRFGIVHVKNSKLKIDLDKSEIEKLSISLKEFKGGNGAKEKALNDALTILSIYKIRENNGEQTSGSMFGYNTWWLSTDISTFRQINKMFDGKYNISCYMRPEFLYSYICFAPKSSEISDAYNDLFPGLLGVNLGSYLPSELSRYINELIDEYKDKVDSDRIIAKLAKLSDSLKINSSLRNKSYIKSYFNSELS